MSYMFNWLMLLTILFAAAFIDYKRYVIPNILVIIGIFTGFFLTCRTFADLIPRILAMLVIFLIGMLRVIGLGDIKLWMVVASFLGFYDSFIVMGMACLLFLLYCILFTRENSLRRLYVYLRNTMNFKTIVRVSGKKYPFAPFIFVSACLMCIYRLTIRG